MSVLIWRMNLCCLVGKEGKENLCTAMNLHVVSTVTCIPAWLLG